jgi:hypothetical protein
MGLMDPKSSNVRKSMGDVWNARPLWLRFVAVFVASALIVVAACAIGMAGDCGPHDQDGQCGLSTFSGILSGLVAGGIVLVVGSIAVFVHWWFTNRRMAAK